MSLFSFYAHHLCNKWSWRELSSGFSRWRKWPEKITIYYHSYYITLVASNSISILVSAGLKSVPQYSTYNSRARLLEFSPGTALTSSETLDITTYLLRDLRQESHLSEAVFVPPLLSGHNNRIYLIGLLKAFNKGTYLKYLELYPQTGRVMLPLLLLPGN